MPDPELLPPPPKKRTEEQDGDILLPPPPKKKVETGSKLSATASATGSSNIPQADTPSFKLPTKQEFEESIPSNQRVNQPVSTKAKLNIVPNQTEQEFAAASAEKKARNKIVKEEALTTTSKKVLESQGKEVTDKSLAEQKAEIQKKVDSGDLVLGNNYKGEKVYGRQPGFIAGIFNGIMNNFAGTVDAVRIKKADLFGEPGDVRKVLDEIENRVPIQDQEFTELPGMMGAAVEANLKPTPQVPSGISAVQPSFGGEVGGFIGGIAPDVMLAMGTGGAGNLVKGGTIGTKMYASSYTPTVMDLYQRGKQEAVNKGMNEEDAADLAAQAAVKNAGIAALPDAALNTAFFMGKLHKAPATKNFLNVLKATVKDGLRVGGYAVGASVLKSGIEGQEGYNVDDWFDKAVESGEHMVAIDALFHVLPLIGAGYKDGRKAIPKALQSAVKEFAVDPLVKPLVEQWAKEHAEGLDVMKELQAYEDATKDIRGIVPQEKMASLGGRIQKRINRINGINIIKKDITELEAKKTNLPESLHKEIDAVVKEKKGQIEELEKEIDGVDKEIESINKSKGTGLEKEVDEATGEPIIPKEEPVGEPEQISQPIELSVEPSTPTVQEGKTDERFTAKGGNKIVDENGTPLEVYHGGREVGESFKDQPTFFTNDKNIAEGFTERYDDSLAGTPIVHKANLEIKNPKIFKNNDDSIKFLDEDIDTINELKEEGYDGAMTKDGTYILVFSNKQIKVLSEQSTPQEGKGEEATEIKTENKPQNEAAKEQPVSTVSSEAPTPKGNTSNVGGDVDATAKALQEVQKTENPTKKQVEAFQKIKDNYYPKDSKVLHHGSSVEKLERDTDGLIWFTDQKKVADDYRKRSVVSNKANLDEYDADVMESKSAIETIADEQGIDLSKGKVFSGQAKMDNVIDLTDKADDGNISNLPKLWNKLHEKGLVEKWKDIDQDYRDELIDEYQGKATWRLLEGENIYDDAKKKGYDGVVISDVGIDGNIHKAYGLFNLKNFHESSAKGIAEAYHKAKKDGSNPELVKAVEQSLKETTKAEAKPVSEGEQSQPIKQAENEAAKENEVQQPTEVKEPSITEANKGVEPAETGGGKEPPKLNEFDKMATSIPNGGEVKKYLSGETIVKYDPETKLRNNQEIVAQELEPALKHGIETIEKAKEIFGDEYVEKTLEYIEREKLNPENKALLYVTLENEMAKRLLSEPDNLQLKKQQDLVRTKSQAFLRSSSLAINMGRLRKFAETGYDISKVTDKFFSPKEKEAKSEVEKLVQADADTIQKEYEAQQETAGFTPEVEKTISEGIEKEINKIYEALPKERKTAADKAIAALDKVHNKLKGRAYESTIGIPIAIIDAGVVTIRAALKAGVKIADAIELGIEKIKEKWGKEWANEDKFRKDYLDAYEAENKKGVIDPKQFVKDALIQHGFGKEVNVKTKKGIEKRKILDWKKLAGEEGSPDKLSENVAKSLAPLAMSEAEIKAMSKSFMEEYDALRYSIVEKGLNEIANRNKTTVTPDQKSAAKKLAEMYNYGLFDKDLVGYETVLAKTIGIDKLTSENLKDVLELGKVSAELFSSSFQGKKLTPQQLRTAIQTIDEKMRYILHKEAGEHGSFKLKAADTVRTYFDLVQRMGLNSLGQAAQNPLSGKMESFFTDVSSSGEIPNSLNKQSRKLAKQIYKEMVLEKGAGFGDVQSQFISKGNLEMEIDKMSDHKLVQGLMSTMIGRTTLDAVDSAFKIKITQQKFAHNLINVLTKDRKVGDKIEKGMTKEEARNYVAEKISGQSLEDAKATAKDIIDKINKGAGKKIFNDSPAYVDRLANDIVNAALINGGKITTEMVDASYNAAYRAAGRGLGHVANNIFSEAIATQSGKIESAIDNAIKDKDYKRATALIYKSIFFRNILNPYVGGGTNWVVLKFEKTGLGLISGLISSRSRGGKLDMTSEAGMKKLEQTMYENMMIRDKLTRGVAGAIATGLALMIVNTDKYAEWKKNHKNLAKYTDLVMAEAALLKAAVGSQEAGDKNAVKRYVTQSVNKNEAFDKGVMAVDAVVSAIKGDEKAGAKAGKLAGSLVGAPTPWRLVRDGQQVFAEFTGGEAYKVDPTPSETFWQAALKGGMIDYMGYAPKSTGEKKNEMLTVYSERNNKKRETTQQEYDTYKKRTEELFNKKVEKLKPNYKVGLNKYGEITIDSVEIEKYKDYNKLTEKEKEKYKSSLKKQAANEAKKEIKF